MNLRPLLKNGESYSNLEPATMLNAADTRPAPSAPFFHSYDGYESSYPLLTLANESGKQFFILQALDPLTEEKEGANVCLKPHYLFFDERDLKSGGDSSLSYTVACQIGESPTSAVLHPDGRLSPDSNDCSTAAFNRARAKLSDREPQLIDLTLKNIQDPRSFPHKVLEPAYQIKTIFYSQALVNDLLPLLEMLGEVFEPSALLRLLRGSPEHQLLVKELAGFLNVDLSIEEEKRVTNSTSLVLAALPATQPLPLASQCKPHPNSPLEIKDHDLISESERQISLALESSFFTHSQLGLIKENPLAVCADINYSNR